MRLLLLDNYDSFTHNLYQMLGEAMLEDGELKGEIVVERNDALNLDEIADLAPTHVVISPGPGHPANLRDFGVCGEVIDRLSEDIPILGVCLGHQGIVHRLGGRVVRAPTIVHGKSSRVNHCADGLFAGLPQGFEAMRYHSFIAERKSIPECLEVTAETAEGLVMGVAHRDRPLVGVQFHPESIGTPSGRSLLERFLAMTAPREV
jgi:anthranilate synthase/aminodeoxychorismate synthase-like glutamine amidotransferase